jgi:hypothetical protein
MHDENERALQRGHFIATRVTEDLYRAVSADAARLGCSMADAVRWRFGLWRLPGHAGGSAPQWVKSSAVPPLPPAASKLS